MKKLLILAALLILLPIISDAAGGHFRKDGTNVAPSPLVEPKERRNTIQPDTIPDNVVIVGPSQQEIHDFLFPTRNDGKVIPAN